MNSRAKNAGVMWINGDASSTLWSRRFLSPRSSLSHCCYSPPLPFFASALLLAAEKFSVASVGAEKMRIFMTDGILAASCLQPCLLQRRPRNEDWQNDKWLFFPQPHARHKIKNNNPRAIIALWHNFSHPVKDLYFPPAPFSKSILQL